MKILFGSIITAATIVTLSIPSKAQVLNQDIFKFMRVYNLVETNYVDTVNLGKLTEAAIVGLLKELDPHSYYITKSELEKVNEEMSGSFEGIGVQFNILNDTVLIISPISGGPSERVGILAGDRIITVNGENIAGVGITNERVFKLLRGAKGTKVELGILRPGINKIETYTVIRDKIPLNSLDAAYMINMETGYIKLNRFSATTMDEFKKASNDLIKLGAKNLVLDLTNNGGGFLNMAYELADEFLEQNKLIVYTEGRNAVREDLKSTAKGSWKNAKVVVMVDEGSASASEIVSGAIQDWDRGIIVGRRTFGKGLVQKQFLLPDGSAMRLTIARYHTPTGRVIQRPYKSNDTEYRKEVTKRFEKGELFSADSITFPDSLKYQTLSMKRTVYGGGGIMPDVFVPIDTSFNTNFYREIIRKGLINQFVLEYLDTKRNELKKQYPTFAEFNQKFNVTTTLFDEFLSYALEKKVTPKESELNRCQQTIEIQIKALLARNLWDFNSYFQIINQLDPIYQAAVEIVSKPEKYKSALSVKK
ncbi:MAG TPA: S41 family peptidase [Salinivirgaceae bacterium]|nr:S41 family peptidase [Salinivirgaceae bacterium]